jgi:hypothetical protein
MLGIEPPAREATDCQRTRSSTKLAGQLANLLFDVIRRDLDAMRVLGGRLFFCLLFFGSHERENGIRHGCNDFFWALLCNLLNIEILHD